MSDIDTAVVDGLKALDPKWPIREVGRGGIWTDVLQVWIPARSIGAAEYTHCEIG